VILLDWIPTAIGWFLSIISIAIAMYQYNDKKKYKYIIKTNSWMLFQRINNIGGINQKAYIESREMNIDKTLYEKIIRSDALMGELYKEAIRLIMISEENITSKDIDKWVFEGRITEGYSKLFKNYLTDNK